MPNSGGAATPESKPGASKAGAPWLWLSFFVVWAAIQGLVLAVGAVVEAARAAKVVGGVGAEHGQGVGALDHAVVEMVGPFWAKCEVAVNLVAHEDESDSGVTPKTVDQTRVMPIDSLTHGSSGELGERYEAEVARGEHDGVVETIELPGVRTVVDDKSLAKPVEAPIPTNGAKRVGVWNRIPISAPVNQSSLLAIPISETRPVKKLVIYDSPPMSIANMPCSLSVRWTTPLETKSPDAPS